MFATFIVGLLLGLVYYAFFYQDKRVKDLIDKIPGPKPLPIIGNAHQLRVGHDWYLQLLEWGCTYRKAGSCRAWLASRPIVIIFKPEYIETLINNTQHIDKATEYDFVMPWLGTGLLTSTGDKWRSRRKMLTPTFHFNILNDFLHVFNRQAEILTKKLEGKMAKGRFDIFQDIALCALDIICETAMGKTLDAQKGDSDYVHAVYRMSTLVDRRIRQPWLWSDLLFNLLGNGKEHSEKLKILHDFTNSVINDRLQDFDQKKAEAVKKELSGENVESFRKVKLAFLDMLLYMSENLTKLDINDIREEVDTFMFEGHDTTASAMNWATFLIGENPDVQAKVHAELDRVFGDDDRDVTTEDLKELKYLECCIKEALRMFPSVPMFGRKVAEDLNFGDFTIPQNTTVVVVVTALHRDPNIFPEPDVFNPDRFLLENSRQRHPYSYIPFSAGPRNCIGQKFALMEEKTVLVHLFRKFTVKSVQQRDELRPVGDLILRPEKGIQIELKPRTKAL